MWCSCGCENGTQVCIPAWVLNVFLLGGHWARRFGCVAVSAKSGVYELHVFIMQFFEKQNWWICTSCASSVGYFTQTHAEREPLNSRAWVMSSSQCWGDQVLNQAVSQLPHASWVNASGHLIMLLRRDESLDVGSLHIQCDCMFTFLLQANTCCCNYSHANLEFSKHLSAVRSVAATRMISDLWG